MGRIIFDEVVWTDYGQLDLTWTRDGGFDGSFDRFFAGQVNGLVGAADPHGVYVNLARRSGGSRVRIVLDQDEPCAPSSRYEDVVEVSTTVPEGAEPRWDSWAAETSGPLPDVAPGAYRLRVSAHGRDLGSDGEHVPGVVDEYVLELWPSESRPDAILRTGSRDAAYWHTEVGGRR